MSDLNQLKQDLRDRLKWLEQGPLEEHRQIEALLQTLDSNMSNNQKTTPVQTVQAAPKQAAGRTAGRRRGRMAGGVRREDQILGYIKQNPGTSVTTISDSTGIHKNYVHKIVRDLRNTGVVSKPTESPELYVA